MIRKFTLSAAFALTSLLTLPAAHADQLDDIRAKGEIVIGVLGTAEPYSYIDPTSRQLVGYEIDLGHEIAQALGVKPVFRQIAVAARIPSLQQGHVDILAAALARIPEREQQIDFSLPIFVTGQKVLVPNRGGLQHVAELDGRKVVTIKGGTQEDNIKAAVPGVTVVSFDSAPQAFLALQQGKAEGFVDDESGLIGVLSKAGTKASDYAILPERVSTTTVGIGLRKNEPALLDAVNAALGALEQDGKAENLFFKWYGPNTRHGFTQRDFRFEASQP